MKSNISRSRQSDELSISAPRRTGTPPLLFGTRCLKPDSTISLKTFSKMELISTTNFVVEVEKSEQPNRVFSEPAHLNRIVHISITEVTKIQKAVSRKWLAILFIPFPILLLFGHGLLDRIADWETNGKVVAFGRNEKRGALLLGYTLITLWMIFLIVAVVFL